MNITLIVFGFIFLIFGILFFFRVILKYLKLWKNMSQEDKSKIKIKPLCRNIGVIISLSGVIFLTSGFSSYFKENFFVLSMVLWMIISIIDAYFIFKKERYVKK